MEIVKFNNTKIVCPLINDEPHVLVKTIIEGIGLNYDYSLFRLKNNDRLKRYLCEYKVISADFRGDSLANLGLSLGYSYTAIPVRKVAAWLFSININKVNKEARPTLEKFQERCDDVLFQYFFGRKELDLTYFDEKKAILMQKRVLEAKIKTLRNYIAETPEGKELIANENELKKIKYRLYNLEQKQFGMIYTLFALPENEK